MISHSNVDEARPVRKPDSLALGSGKQCGFDVIILPLWRLHVSNRRHLTDVTWEHLVCTLGQTLTNQLVKSCHSQGVFVFNMICLA